MSTLPNFVEPIALRCFLLAQSIDVINPDVMTNLLAKLRHLPVTEDNKREYHTVPLEKVGEFLDAILLAYANTEFQSENTNQQSDGPLPIISTKAFLERFRPTNTTRVLCGYLFQRNDIVFNCKTCQFDETCVLCLNCFQNGNHEGHDVYFHRTSPGGVCDCGDSEAWAPEGFCVYHGHKNEVTEGCPRTGSMESLPDNILRVADALFQAIVSCYIEMATQSMKLFDAEFVDANGRQMVHALRLRLQREGKTMDDVQHAERQFHVRICNDDIHSDEDLIRSLSQKQIPRAEALVRAIDSNGSEIVANNLLLRDALALMQALKSEGWHVCVVQDQFIHDEDVLLHITRWIKTICSLSEQLHELFCNKLFATDGQQKEPIQIMFLSDPYFRKDLVLELYELYLRLQGVKGPKLQFSIVFIKVYNRMMLKYFCGVGTREESLFQYGVQILTTPSIVHHLIKDGLMEMLLDTINTALEMARTHTISLQPHHSIYRTLDCDHPLLKFKRYHFVIENFGYVLGIPAMSSAFLLRSDLLEKWLCALAEVQDLDPQLRIQNGRAHVTFETQSWLTAFAFHAHVSKLHSIVSKGIRFHEAVDASTCNQERERMVFNMLEGFWDQMDRSVTHQMELYSSPCGRLLGSHCSKEIVKYDIMTQPVSFHHPLHGLLAFSLIESLYFGPASPFESAKPWISNWTTLLERTMAKILNQSGSREEELNKLVRQKKILIYALMEFPLRSMALSAHITCGLWIRNGQNMQRQLFNYMSPPWCKELRDSDLFLVQVSAAVVRLPTFLTIFFDRFGLAEWLVSWANIGNPEYESLSVATREDFASASEDEKLVSVLETALLQLLWIVTELTPDSNAIEQRDIVLRREVLHRLSQNPYRLSELLDQTEFVVSSPFGGLTTRQERQHLARLEQILDEIADVQVKRSHLGAPLGDGACEADSMGDGSMEPTTYFLKGAYYKEYDPSFYHLSRSSHEKAQDARQEALFKTWRAEDPPIPLVSQLPPPHMSFGIVRFLVLEKGLLGILRLILEDVHCPGIGSLACDRRGKKTNAMVILRAIHLINVAVLVLQRGNDKAILPQETEPVLSESKIRQTLLLLRNGPEAFRETDVTSRGKKRVKRQSVSSDEVNVQMNRENEEGETNDVHDLSIVALLVALSKDMAQHDFEASKSTISAIYWILNNLAALDSVIYVYLELRVWSGMKKHEEMVTEVGMSKSERNKLRQQRAIAAMMARQKSFAQSSAFAEMDDAEQLDGTGFSGNTRVQLNNHDTDPEHSIVYQPPSPPDCIICSQKEREKPMMYIGHAQMSKVNSHATENLPRDMTKIVTDEHNSSSALTTAFPPAIHLSLCGHAVHLHCWQKYFELVRAQSRFNFEHNQTSIAFDANFGEFLCPLCQALSSMLVPYLPVCPPLTSANQVRDRIAMEQVFQSKQDTSTILSWLSNGLPSRIDSIDPGNNEMNAEEGNRLSINREDDIHAMNQFAVGFLETMLRFQPEMTHLATAMSALKNGFFSTGAQLTHLIWSSVASTITSTQLSGISSAMHSLETFSTSKKGNKSSSIWQPPSRSPTTEMATSAATAYSLVSLRITDILNPAVPPLKTRVGVSLPEALDPQLDQYTPKDDSKLNILLRPLRNMSLLFTTRHHGFYRSMCFPVAQNLRLALSSEQWLETLSQGPPLQLGLPILSQDLFYLCVAICSSMLTTKSEILLTIRSLCVLYMAQVLIQLAQMEAEDEDEDDCLGNELSDERRRALVTVGANDELYEQREDMQLGLETLMARLAFEAGVTCDRNREDVPCATRRPALQGRQLQLLFESSCTAFMRQATLLCRAFFRGEQDPDVSWSANFVSSLRLSTNYHEMCQQLGIPRISQLLVDEQLIKYLLRAARELRTRITSGAVSEEAQAHYQHHGNAEQLITEVQTLVFSKAKQDENTLAEWEARIARGNFQKIPKLPLRLEPDVHQPHKSLFHFANIRLVKLAHSYTSLHSEVLGRSKCRQTLKTMENPAICLVCEHILCAGTECCRRRNDGIGACTYHAITCGAGVGLFFLMRSSSVLLVYGPRSSYFGSPYLDMFGEEDINVRRGRPLYLSATRMRALQTLYANHQLANEVARNRRTSDQYIRNNYY
ncbi:e3 ubiquitin-protein ligase [Plasmopara halstedii]|uniref:E3 ubiquitin-protein ligase n=1 Tax=Plasmopara halstedii TaxID=4781 RepID=A0A0P1A8F1_PLAHL|nr:e3 ubiquitin-protein ligase [Plasmopara halstedii]CEG36557.1 e3 ubiquitin-protein ligase [Plasmopara halstedii]|eukprot:XP_024572926.1 e3 ubiquitin-protein ligase [Plasmopara halstedii]